MTQREKEILKWIEEDPMISQQEIADRASITRSSVAVHISNLMKKGCIKGKGYVVQAKEYITVIGAVNIDLCGTSTASIIEKDSNPGKLTTTIGGVGRNIAENLSRLDYNVEMITVLGDDVYALEIQKNARENNIQLTHTLRLSDVNTSTYLCINDPTGELVLAISDMDIYKQLTPAYLQSKLDFINRSALVVLDANCSQESIAYLCDHCRVPLFIDPVSTIKATKLLPTLGKFHTIKPNRSECEILSGIKIVDDASLKQAALRLIDAGVKQVFISLSSEGVYYASKKVQGKYPCYKGEIVNTNGCGDAFMAACIHGYLSQCDVSQAAQYGLAASSICAQSSSSISNELKLENLENKIKENGGFTQ